MSPFESVSITGRVYGAEALAMQFLRGWKRTVACISGKARPTKAEVVAAFQERSIRTHNGEIPARIMDALDSYFITKGP